MSRLLSSILDEKDPIAEAYYLEVSSAGMNRPLTRPEHFAFYLGQPVSVRLYAPLDGKKSFVGDLISYDGEEICLAVEGQSLRLKKEAVAKVVTAEE